MDTGDHNPKVPTAQTPSPATDHDLPCSSSGADTDSDDDFFQIDGSDLAHLPPIPTPDDPLIDLDDSRVIERRSPVVQVMERNEGVDLGRIPSSVFARSSPTPIEWSVASNESLFSIHMGSLSFSKDQVFLAGRSGDFGLIDYPPPVLPPPAAILPSPAMIPAVCPVAVRENVRAAIVDLGEMEEAAATANAEAMRDLMVEKEKEREKPPLESPAEPLGRSISRHSDGSTTSFQSFAFPILTVDGRIGSTKVDSVHHTDYHPLSQVTARKTAATTTAATAAVAAAPSSSHGPAPASIESLGFPCFSCCRFCC